MPESVPEQRDELRVDDENHRRQFPSRELLV